METSGKYKDVPFTSLEGETIVEVEGLQYGSGEIYFKMESGKIFKMHHYQDCCESVLVEEVVGELAIPFKVLKAYETVSENMEQDSWGSATWTFYTIASVQSTVVIRWLGESNGYYSESVSFTEKVGE